MWKSGHDPVLEGEELKIDSWDNSGYRSNLEVG